MCQCKQQNEAALREHYTKKMPEGSTGLKVSLGGYAMVFGGPTPFKNYSEVTVTFDAPTKGTTKKPSVMRSRKETVSLVGNFCMFCGVKYPTKESEAADAAAAAAAEPAQVPQ